ncbi:permease [Ectobacillus antri]|jgi:membrane-bound metal-dependent hydrolase YbcI (DUF457 family)|uniref:Permease n=1 Tax=Ectobacillus antri TaxID=2486280 RepID=A0ABT6H685_9BACI|nr:permease [Ectobacillus antri]MDG4657035.1 permease [Ectobacillus antri]MDG5754137.1 permease [Ectobacillus antri]
MFAGHFGVAAAAKAKAPRVPLWALMVGTQLIDIIFVPLLLSRIEGMEQVQQKSYGGMLIFAQYSHSLIGALLISAIVWVLARIFWGNQGAVVLAGVVLSHWFLDLLVHRADLPILPGNMGDLPLLGFGLWESSVTSVIIEFILILIGMIFYTRSALQRGQEKKRRRAVIASAVMSILLVLALLTDFLGVS